MSQRLPKKMVTVKKDEEGGPQVAPTPHLCHESGEDHAEIEIGIG
jgi:hypothetical protein